MSDRFERSPPVHGGDSSPPAPPLPSSSPSPALGGPVDGIMPAMAGNGDADGDSSGLGSLFPLDGGDSASGPFPIGGFSSLLFQDDVDFATGFSASVAGRHAATDVGKPAAPPRTTTAEEKKVAREKALAVKRRRAHRERVKQQLLELRRQMGELSAHLQELQATHGGRVNDRATRLRIWKSIAARQDEARAAAVAHNRKLRAQVLRRQTQLRGLFGALYKQPVRLDPTAGSKPPDIGPLEPADSSLFDAFLDELDAAYAQTDAVLRASGLSGLSGQSSGQKVTRRWDAERGSLQFELADSRVLPFSFVQTRSVLWQSIVRVHCRNPQELYSRVADPGNTIAVKCRVDCQVPSRATTAPLVVYLALRRYTESDRTVLVWRALSEGRGDLSGLFSDETGWTVLRPKTGSSEAGDEATAMETCTRFEPICSGVGEDGGASVRSGGEADADLFTSLLVDTVDQDNADITHLMADLILKDLLAPHLSPGDSAALDGEAP